MINRALQLFRWATAIRAEAAVGIDRRVGNARAYGSNTCAPRAGLSGGVQARVSQAIGLASALP